MEGEETTTVVDREGNTHEVPPTVREKLDAAKWLADRGFGRIPLPYDPPKGDEPPGDGGEDMSDDDLEAALGDKAN